MPTFQFRLATLLRLRAARRDDRRAILAEAERAADLIVERIAGLNSELEELRARSRTAAQPGAVDVNRLADAQRYESILHRERTAAEQQRHAANQVVQECRDELVAADRDVKILENLRKTQRTRHREDEARQEIKALDETALLRHRDQEVS